MRSSDGPATPRRAEARTPRGSCTGNAARAFSPKCILPAHLRESWVHAGTDSSGDSEREWGSHRPERRCRAPRTGCSAPSAEMHSHSRTCSRPGCAFRARSLGLTERGSLAGPGPKLTTCFGASMVLRRRWQRSGREPAALASRVGRLRQPSAFFSRAQLALRLARACSRSCYDWSSQRGSHPHWSRSLAEAGSRFSAGV